MKKCLSKFLVAIMLVTTTGALIGCTNGTAASVSKTSTPTSGKKIVGYCVPDTTEPFLANLTNTVKKKFAVDGVDVQIADAHGDATTQLNQIQNFIAMKANLIIIMAVDPTSCSDAIKQAQVKGVKVLVAGGNTGVYDAIMHTDQLADGKMIAKMTADWISATFPGAAKESVDVAIFEERSTPEATLRSDGMKEIATLSPAAKIVKTVGSIKNIDTAQTAAENLFQTNPNVKAILCYNNGGSLGVSAYVSKPGSAVKDKTKFGTFGSDYSPESIQAVVDSATNASVFRGVVKFGSNDLPGDTYNLAKKIINAQSFDKENLDPLTAITPKNAAEFK